MSILPSIVEGADAAVVTGFRDVCLQFLLERITNQQHGLDPAAHAQLFEDALQVGLDRVFGDAEQIGNLAVAFALGNQG